jgi:hypothetical protein
MIDPTTTIGVAGIPLVDMSEPCHAAFAAILGWLTSGENRPGDAGEFVGECPSLQL